MRKRGLIILSLLASTLLSGCSFSSDSLLSFLSGGTYSSTTSTHTHTYSTEWSYDETKHWHAPTCSDITSVADEEEHTFGVESTIEENNTYYHLKICTVCGYKSKKEVSYYITRDEWNLALKLSSMNVFVQKYDVINNVLLEEIQNSMSNTLIDYYYSNNEVLEEYYVLNSSGNYILHSSINQVGEEVNKDSTPLSIYKLGLFENAEFSNIYNSNKKMYMVEGEDDLSYGYLFIDQVLSSVTIYNNEVATTKYTFSYSSLPLNTADYANRCIHEHTGSGEEVKGDSRRRYICTKCGLAFLA